MSHADLRGCLLTGYLYTSYTTYIDDGRFCHKFSTLTLYHSPVCFLIISCHTISNNKNPTSYKDLSLLLTCPESSGGSVGGPPQLCQTYMPRVAWWSAGLDCFGLAAVAAGATWLCFMYVPPPTIRLTDFLMAATGVIKQATMRKPISSFCLYLSLTSHWPRQVTWLSQSQGAEQVALSPDGGSSKVTWQRVWTQRGVKN